MNHRMIVRVLLVFTVCENLNGLFRKAIGMPESGAIHFEIASAALVASIAVMLTASLFGKFEGVQPSKETK